MTNRHRNSHIILIERENIRKRMEEAKFLTLIVDGTTDSGTVEADMVYARYCARGQIYVNFFQLCECWMCKCTRNNWWHRNSYASPRHSWRKLGEETCRTRKWWSFCNDGIEEGCHCIAERVTACMPRNSLCCPQTGTGIQRCLRKVPIHLLKVWCWTYIFFIRNLDWTGQCWSAPMKSCR